MFNYRRTSSHNLPEVRLFCDCMAATDEYRSRQHEWLQRRQDAEQLFIRIGNARLAVGVTEAVLAYAVFGLDRLPAFSLAIPVVVFIVLAVWQSRVIRRRTL